MSSNENNETQQSIENVDHVLMMAWKRVFDLSTVSTVQKEKYTSFRSIAIALSLLTTFFAVFSSIANLLTGVQSWYLVLYIFIALLVYPVSRWTKDRLPSDWKVFPNDHQKALNKNTNQLINGVVLTTVVILSIIFIIGVFVLIFSNQQPLTLPAFLRFVVFVLPLAGVLVVAWADRFYNDDTWINYRKEAESIRSEIFIYRVKKFVYDDDANTEHVEILKTARDKLINLLKAGTKNQNNVPYIQMYKTEGELINSIRERRRTDDKPMSSLSIEDYIKIRARRQLNWY
ncbi:MAG: DUF4231 domain-containing protein, partial [Chloroflexota bacterium]